MLRLAVAGALLFSLGSLNGVDAGAAGAISQFKPSGEIVEQRTYEPEIRAFERKLYNRWRHVSSRQFTLAAQLSIFNEAGKILQNRLLLLSFYRFNTRRQRSLRLFLANSNIIKQSVPQHNTGKVHVFSLSLSYSSGAVLIYPGMFS